MYESLRHDPFQAAAQKDEILVINDKLDNFSLFHGILLPLLLLLPCLIYLFGQQPRRGLSDLKLGLSDPKSGLSDLKSDPQPLNQASQTPNQLSQTPNQASQTPNHASHTLTQASRTLTQAS